MKWFFMNMMNSRVAFFTDSWICKDKFGRFFSVRDNFPKFILPLGKELGHLRIISRCQKIDTTAHEDKYLPQDSFTSFRPLPFYESTEEYYKKAAFIAPMSLPKISEEIKRSDVVILRIHHCMAWPIARLAGWHNKPLCLYWAGPPIVENARKNYSGTSMKDLIARFVARVEHYLNRKILNRCTWNFFVDQNEYELMGAPPNSSFVTPNLIPSKSISPSPVPKKKPIQLIFAGRLFKHKGVWDLVKAVEEIVRENKMIVLRIAGEGPEGDRIRDYITKKGLGAYIRLEGGLSYFELQALLKKMNVLIMPSYAEGMPKVIWEAFAAGLAVVSTRVGAIPRYISDRKNGLLIEKGNKNELIQAITILCKDDHLYYTLARGGIMTVHNYTWNKQIELIAQQVKFIRKLPSNTFSTF